ncbi:MAG TPA: hypothetical protein VG457_09675, partial [Planctomycetota bacterium]|nr:hypothetical protein [Planctomycetota bacterium]
AAALSLAQDPELAGRLKREGWKAVEDLATKPAARTDLEKLAGGEDRELQWWAGAALSEIEAREKGGAAWIGVLPVTLQAKEKKAHEILSELFALEKLRLEGRLALAEKAVSVSFQGVPFFQAVDEVCLEAGCRLRRRTDGAFELMPDDGQFRRPDAYAGPLAFTVGSVTFRSTADFRKDPQQRLELGLSVRVDPRAWIRPAEARWEFVSATDDTGAALEIRNSGGFGFSGQQPYSLSLKAWLSPPGKAVRKIASVRGTVRFPLCRDLHELVFSDVANAPDQTREVGGMQITLKPLQVEDRTCSVHLEVSPKEAPGAPGVSDLVLEDSGGRKFLSSGGSSGNGFILKMFRMNENMKAPERLQVTVMPDLHVRKLYFELKDIPLP